MSKIDVFLHSCSISSGVSTKEHFITYTVNFNISNARDKIVETINKEDAIKSFSKWGFLSLQEEGKYEINKMAEYGGMKIYVTTVEVELWALPLNESQVSSDLLGDDQVSIE